MKYKYEDISSIDKIFIGFSNFLLNNLQAEHGKLKYRKNKSNFDWILNMWYSWKKNQNVHPIKELEGKLYTNPPQQTKNNMTAEQFTYWLQGFMELTSMNHLSTTQFQIVKDHLDLVFEKQTPNRLTKIPTQPYITQPHPGPLTINPNPIPYNPNTIICSAGDISSPTTNNGILLC